MFLCILYQGSQTSSFAWDMRPHSGPFLSFLASIYGGSLKSVSLHRIWGPPQFFRLLLRLPYVCFLAYFIGALQISFFAYYIGAPSPLSTLTIWGPFRSVSSHTIWGPSQFNLFACYIYGSYYMRGGGLRSVSLHAIARGH